jgi:hypothetical protein
VDSVIYKKPPPPVASGQPFGPISVFDAANPAPFTGDGGESAGKPEWLADKITEARQKKLVIIANLPCGGHNESNLGRCLALKNGVATFSKARWDSAIGEFNTPAVRTLLAQAVKDSVIAAVNIMDEPWVSGGGDGNTWGPEGTMTRQRVDSLCRQAKTILGPTVPVGTSDQTKWQRSTTYKWKWCDVGIAQYSHRFGTVTAWRDSILSVSSAQGYLSVFSFNFINGGTQDRDGPWDCPGGHKGQRSPNCQFTPAQIITVVTALGDKGCGLQTFWRYDAARFALGGYATAFQQAATLQKQRPRKLCKVRSP